MKTETIMSLLSPQNNLKERSGGNAFEAITTGDLYAVISACDATPLIFSYYASRFGLGKTRVRHVPDGDLCLVLEFGVSNMGSDTDNMIKPFQDALQEKYGFNDSRIVSLQAKKTKVSKGAEFINWNLTEHVE